jgi:hypothetical protein
MRRTGALLPTPSTDSAEATAAVPISPMAGPRAKTASNARHEAKPMRMRGRSRAATSSVRTMTSNGQLPVVRGTPKAPWSWMSHEEHRSGMLVRRTESGPAHLRAGGWGTCVGERRGSP